MTYFSLIGLRPVANMFYLFFYVDGKRRSPEVCARRLEEAKAIGRTCLKQCDTDKDCKSKRKRCLCDGVCGMSCIKPDLRCAPPPSPENGQVRVTDDLFGAEAYYTCTTGFRLVGPEHRVCQADSTWSGTDPQCLEATYCGPPPHVANAFHSTPANTQQFEVDAVVQYTCSLGYHSKGFARAKCIYYNGTASWFGPDVECMPISCGNPGEVTNAIRLDSAFTFSSRVIYKCREGFDLVGKNNRVCQGNGHWTGPLPTCRAVQCPVPDDPTNGRALYSLTSYDSEVSYECQYGHVLVGDTTRRCGADKQWTGVKPYCKEIDCGSPGVLYNGWLEGDNTNLGSVVLFRCNEGMKFEGASMSTTCQLDGKWSHSLPSCMAPCIIPEVAHGVLVNATPGTTVAHGQRIQITCDERYEITYNATWVQCMNGSWSAIPTCEPARCKTLPSRPRHGMVIAPKTEHGQRAMYKCRDGYVLRGNNITECQFGQWTGQLPYCQEIYCPFPGAIEHGKVLLVGNMGLYDYRPYVRKVTNNRQIMYDCDKGYVLVDGPPGATCIGGRWSPKPLPRCQPGRHPRLRWLKRRRKRMAVTPNPRLPSSSSPTPSPAKRRSRRHPAPCDLIPDAPYIHVEVVRLGDGNSSMPHGTELEIHCARGYGLNIGNRTAKCVRGKWRPRTPECVTLACKVPRSPNGVYHHQDLTVPEHSEISHGEVLTYSCLPGYQIHGVDSMRCWFGEWAVEVYPDCTPAPCELPHVTHGQYGGGYRAGLTIAHGSTVEYECETEYIKTTLRPIRCHLGELKPRVPACRHHSVHVIPVLDGYPHEADVHFKQPGSDISVIDFPASSFRRSCGPPERVQNALVYRDGRLITDNDHRFLDGTEVLFDCIASITGEKTTWKIVCEDGAWVGRPHRCEGDPGSDHYEYLRNRSCVFRNTEPHLVTFYGDMRITDETMEFPPGTELVSRCRDVGKYALLGSVKRRCIGGEWDGVKPTCFGLSQENDYALEKPPTILFRHQLGPIAQSNDGRLIVYPGTILHLECLWLRKFGTPHWETSQSFRKYPEGWTADPGRDSQLEYRLSIYHAQRDDSGTYACVTPKQHRHVVDIVVKAVHCPRIPERPGLHVSNPSNKMNTRVTFSCRNGNALIGAEHAVCLPSGNWSAAPPACENVECPETIPVTDHALKVQVNSREAGGHAVFSCAPGYGLRGPNEAVCESTGQWSQPFPHCEEVRCAIPEAPPNGYTQGKGGIYKAGDVVQFNCNQGFMMEGQAIVVCQDNGRWSGPVPNCVQACTYPGTTVGGTVSRVKFYYSIGETVTFECAQGLELRGAHMLRCLPNGKWSNAIPSCIPSQG